MKSQSVGLRVSSVIFGLLCLFYVVRQIKGVDVAVGSHHISAVQGIVAIIVSAALCVWLWWLACPCCCKSAQEPPVAPKV